MNVLAFVFSFLLLLSFGFYSSWHRQRGSIQLLSTWQGNEKAHRALHNRYQSEVYRNFPGKSTQPRKKQESHTPKTIPAPELNSDCAKINLSPLIQDGKERHPELYALAEQTLTLFYSHLSKEPNFARHLLDAILKEARASQLSLEKLSLGPWQRLYYKLLKGTKEWSLASHKGYPSLLDYMKIDEHVGKICICHAHPDLLHSLFGAKTADRLYSELHQEKRPAVTPEFIEQICRDSYQIPPNKAFFDLLDLTPSHHSEYQKTLFAKDEASGISLRQNVCLKKIQ